MRKVYFFFKNYLFDFIASVSAIFLTWITFSFAQSPQSAFIFSVAIIFLFLFVVIYLRKRERDFYFIPFDNRKDKDDWIGSGVFEFSRTKNCFEISQASPGYVYAKCLTWSDYKYEFEFKLRKKCLGVVVRSVNLSNYVMLQIEQSGINPHLRINGGWRRWGAEEVGLLFPNNLSKDKWYKCELLVDKNIINIKIYHKKAVVLDDEWTILQGNIIFEFKKDDKDLTPISIPFPINLEYGSGGFRNFGEEKALVKNVLFKKI